MLNDLSARLCIAAQNERALAFNPVETRLAQLLMTYVDMYGLPVEGGTKIRIPLTQEELANSLGVARRSVTRALKRWSEAGILRKAGRHFIVREVKSLAAFTQPKLLGISYRTGSDIGRRLQSKSK